MSFILHCISGLLFVWTILFSLAFLPSTIFASNLPLRDVLVLHSYHSGLDWTEKVNQGIEEILLAKDRQDIELHIEYMDALRWPSADNVRGMHRYLKEKYKKKRFSAVIGVNVAAVTFLQKYHPELFPMIPILYCGVPCPEDGPQFANFVGVCENIDLIATIEAGLTLYPATTDIHVINDRSADGLIHDALIDRARQFFGGRVAIHVWDDLTMAQLQEQVRELSGNRLMIMMNFTLDSNGETFSHERGMGLIAARCKVPVFSMWQSYLGNGVLGGMMVDGTAQGREVAKKVVDIFMGDPVESLAPVSVTENRLVFDYNQMERFAIPYKVLPEGSVVTDEPQSILWKYKKIGFTVLGIALALEATVIILSVVTYRSKKAEQVLEELVEKRTHELTRANEKLKGEIHVRKKIEEALRDSEETLHQLSINLLTIQENERRRISLELHDELGQSLAALKMQVGSLEKQLGPTAPLTVSAGCSELRESINLIIENVRRLSRDLSPVALDDLGIDAALEYLITTFAKLHEIEVVMDLIEINHFFGQEEQRLIYRIVQESLNNIGKHAHATQVVIRIEKMKNRIFLIVKDNGTGFNAEAILNNKRLERGMGLAAMEERVRILHGAMDIDSEPGRGTTITVILPV
ncbi:MAG: ATP-binding protein [Thermodesulfobacteriota bacterium]